MCLNDDTPAVSQAKTNDRPLTRLVEEILSDGGAKLGQAKSIDAPSNFGWICSTVDGMFDE